MRGYTVQPSMTPKRLAYLQAVERNGTYEPRHGACANHCIVLGWVETVLRMPDGRLVGFDDLPVGEERWNALQSAEIIGQRLTAKGKAELNRTRTEAKAALG